MTWDEMDKEYGHNLTTYSSREEMKAVESGLPFDDEPENGCWNCSNYDGDACMKNWNNGDEDYYCPETDDHAPDYYCDDWELEPGSIWEDFFGEDY